MDDLESIKRADLRDYASRMGYMIDKRESYRSGTVMRLNGDKIVVQRKPEGHWTYWSVRDEKDHGTAIDFCIRRTGKPLGEAINELREWLCLPPQVANGHLPNVEPIAKDRVAVEFEWNAMKIARRHSYLEKERGIPALVFGEYWRFRGLVRNDKYGNTCFAHFDDEGLCGYEIRGPKFKGFAKGATKGIFRSKRAANDTRLIVCESGIEDLSICTLTDDGRTRYASMAGQFSEAQRELLQREIQRLGSGEVVAAMNADDAGRKLGDRVRDEVERSHIPNIVFTRYEPKGCKDWNDVLLADKNPATVRLRTLVPA